MKNVLLEFYDSKSQLYKDLLLHSKMVAIKAVELALFLPKDSIDVEFVEKAAMIHDIGIIKTNAPKIGCLGDAPYICHGVLGREMMESLGYNKLSLVCERHIGTGITINEIINNNWPLPLRDMQPISIEEQLVCFADKFFSKVPGKLVDEKNIEDIKSLMLSYGNEQFLKFNKWNDFFNKLNK